MESIIPKNDRLATSPQDLVYMKLLKYGLSIINAWPETKSERANKTYYYSYFLLVQSNVFLLLILTYMYQNFRTMTFMRAGHTILTVLFTLLSFSRMGLSFSNKYHEVGKMFLTELHVFYIRHKSDYNMKVDLQVHTFCHLFTVYSYAQFASGASLYNVGPIYQNYAAGLYGPNPQPNATFEHAVYFYIPKFDSETTFTGYIILFIINFYLAYICMGIIIIVDLVLAIMVFHLWGHLKILNYNLETFPLPAAVATINDASIVHLYTKEESEKISVTLKNCIDHHRFLRRFADAMTGAFGYILFAYYGFHQISGCIVLLECSQSKEALISYGILTLWAFQELTVISTVFELVGSMSEKTTNSAYSVPWEYMDTSNRKTFLIFLVAAQQPIRVKALGMTAVGVLTMLSIIKTSYGYFAFLRSASD